MYSRSLRSTVQSKTEYPSDFAQRITDEGGSQGADQHDAEAGQVDEERRFLGRESRTTASRPMLATMPIRVEGFIGAPLRGLLQKTR